MKAGDLDRTIVIQRATETLDEARVPSVTWAPLATVRAAIVKAGTVEAVTGAGNEAQDTTTFRIRYLAGITVADRISYDGQLFDIQGVAEIGRREGLDIRAMARVP